MGFLKTLMIVSVAVAAAGVLWQWRRVNSVDLDEFYRGKRVIITGASRGIGRGLALRLAQAGAKLVINARSADKLADTQRQCLTHDGAEVLTVVGDVSARDVCQQMVETAAEEFGGVDIVIINAALTPTPPQDFLELENPGATFSRYFGVNVLQAVYLTELALPYLNASGGIIVPVSSATGHLAVPKVSPYQTSKHALQGFFKSLNQELTLSKSPVSITIMPLPYVLTETAINQWKLKEGYEDWMGGVTVEDCVEAMLRGIPLRQLWYYVDWTGYIIMHLYSIAPTFFDSLLLAYLPAMSEYF